MSVFFLTELEANEWFKALYTECFESKMNDFNLVEPDLLATGVYRGGSGRLFGHWGYRHL